MINENQYKEVINHLIGIDNFNRFIHCKKRYKQRIGLNLTYKEYLLLQKMYKSKSSLNFKYGKNKTTYKLIYYKNNAICLIFNNQKKLVTLWKIPYATYVEYKQIRLARNILDIYKDKK